MSGFGTAAFSGKKIAKHLMQAKMEFGTEMIPSSDKEPEGDKD